MIVVGESCRCYQNAPQQQNMVRKGNDQQCKTVVGAHFNYARCEILLHFLHISLGLNRNWSMKFWGAEGYLFAVGTR
eukprot:6257559-Amphidinium_carterae.1